MIPFTRSQAREFRAVTRKAGIGKPVAGRGQNFTVLAAEDGLWLRAMSFSAAIELLIPGSYSADQFSLPLDALADCEGRTDEPVTIERQGESQLVLR